MKSIHEKRSPVQLRTIAVSQPSLQLVNALTDKPARSTHHVGPHLEEAGALRRGAAEHQVLLEIIFRGEGKARPGNRVLAGPGDEFIGSRVDGEAVQALPEQRRGRSPSHVPIITAAGADL